MAYCEPEHPTCFENIIEVKGNCTGKTAYSGIYLDDIGIKLGELNDIVGSEYVNGEELFYEKRNYAIKSVTSSVHTHLSSDYKAKSLLESMRVGQFQDNLQVVAADVNQLKGIYVEMCNQDSFVDFFLNFLELQLNFTGNVDVYVYDTIQNRLLDTFPVPVVAEQISQWYVNKTYKSDRKRLSLFIGYDTTGTASFKTYLRNGVSCWSCDNYWMNAQYVKFSGARIAVADDKILRNFTRTGETFGMSLNYSINCNHEDWLCSHARALAIPIALYTAKEIADYAVNVSQRANPKTFIDAEKWKARHDKYDSDFDKRFAEVINNINLPTDSRCFVCSPKIKHAIILP